jgi:hypothetical protein
MHFEDIWIDAEETAKKYPKDLTSKELVLARLQAAVDLLEREERSTIGAQEMIVGNVLYELACYCMLMDRDKSLPINSARAMKVVTDDKKIILLDPDININQL